MDLYSEIRECHSSLLQFLPQCKLAHSKLSQCFREILQIVGSVDDFSGIPNDFLRIGHVIRTHYNGLLSSNSNIFLLYEDPFEPLILFYLLFCLTEQLRDFYVIRDCCVYGFRCPNNCVMNNTFVSAFTATINFFFLMGARVELRSRRGMINAAYDNLCSICLIPLSSNNSPLIYLMKCKHIFCEICFVHWTKRQLEENALRL